MSTRFGEYVLDAETRQVRRAGVALHVTPKAFELLEFLVERRPRALSKSQILQRVWPATFVSESNLASLVKELRRALGDDAERPRFIRTVRRFGYAFVAEATSGEEPDRPSPAVGGETEFRVLWDRHETALAPGENVLGRTRQAAVWVDHGSVSRRHAVIHVEGDVATLEDCGSKNGTSLGGQPLTAAQRLKHGDEIRLGQARLVFRAYRAGDPTATAGRDGDE